MCALSSVLIGATPRKRAPKVPKWFHFYVLFSHLVGLITPGPKALSREDIWLGGRLILYKIVF